MTTAAYLLDALAIALLLWRWPTVRGTTLVGPWSWLLFSLAIAAFAVKAVPAQRLSFAVLSLCPSMSLLGSKRPQDKPWHFIVATLWLVLALPGIQSWALGKGSALETHPARAWFLVVLVVFGVVNSLFSRYWPGVILAGVGQLILLSPFLPAPVANLVSSDAVLGLICYAVAAILAVLMSLAARPRNPSLDTLWRDFRDAFGLVWSVRVAERINHTARANGWDISLHWDGFHGGDAVQLSDDQQRAFRQSISNLLRRFVDASWIARRVGEGTNGIKGTDRTEGTD